MQAVKAPLIDQEERDGRTSDNDASRSKSRSWFFQAWRVMVGSGALAGALVLLINLITLAVMYGRYDVVDHTITFFTGSCQTTSTVTIISHVLINVLSTVLLAASNFSMQCLGSPTRKEVDAAHSRQHWLSIGTPTIRNIFFVSKFKTFLWLLLAASSFPLHLIWNSTVFETKSTNDYLAVTVTEDFLHGVGWTLPSNATDGFGETIINTHPRYHNIIGDLQQRATSNSTDGLEFLTPEQCIRSYGQDLQSNRRHVLLVVDNNTTSVSSVLAIYYNAYSGTIPTWLWMCNSSLTPNDVFNGGEWNCPSDLLKSSVDHWVPGGAGTSGEALGSQESATVRYCYSERTPEQCKANIVPLFLIIVIICNVFKIASFLFVLRITKKDQPLCTTGDAIQSFLERPDEYTKRRCLVAKYDYEKIFHRSREWRDRALIVGDVWTGGRWRWGKAVTNRQWTLFILLISLVIMLAGFFYGPDGIGNGTTLSWSAIINLGIGQPHPAFTATDMGVSNILTGFLSANIPQLIVSYLYLGLNNVMTTMLAMAEWCDYAVRPKSQAKGLRVSTPVPHTDQRSTYTLSVPFKWAIPTTLCILLLHWLVSQMVFLARIEVYDVNAGQSDKATSTLTDVFFSPLAMLIAVSLGSAMVVTLVAIAIFKKYPDTIPLAGCCSASIAAACQPLPNRRKADESQVFAEGLALKKLQWGVMGRSAGELGAGIAHATFDDAEDLRPLIMGKIYA